MHLDLLQAPQSSDKTHHNQYDEVDDRYLRTTVRIEQEMRKEIAGILQGLTKNQEKIAQVIPGFEITLDNKEETDDIDRNNQKHISLFTNLNAYSKDNNPDKNELAETLKQTLINLYTVDKNLEQIHLTSQQPHTTDYLMEARFNLGILNKNISKIEDILNSTK
jgi:DNA-binding transcriptional MocR family regulator